MVGPGLGQRPLLKLVFFPEDTSILNVSVNTAPGTGLKETDSVVRELSRDLRETGFVEAAVGLSGIKLDTTYRPQFGHQFGLILAEFPVVEERTFDNPVDYYVKSVNINSAIFISLFSLLTLDAL